MRNLDPAFVAALRGYVIVPAILADLTFASGTTHAWTGYGPLTWSGNTYLGVGQLAGIGDITEGIRVQADGTTVSLSGIDPALYDAAMADIQLGAPATLWLALLSQGQVVSVYQHFQGLIDQPTVSPGPDTITISIALENKMTNLQRASARRYTSADQHIAYPDDIAFSWVECLNDIAIRWA